ncbi:PQQ-binding-like beta-propeller repeat protein [Nocardia mikamii]|uniref:PQQ-binding-like beta-propeller repeat protein n=1 Tax=Nocardia mikamii TaxID=508464 RepID=UPI0007A3EAE8|nr:PQQ-binding-like beta-propeller repeat protein [Nocardia mikamii]
MPTIASTDGRFFVITDCVPQVRAAAAAAAAGGTLAALTTATAAEITFPEGAFADVAACATPQDGPTAWFATFNGGVPDGCVYAIDLTTGKVCTDNANRAAAWTRFVLAAPA